MDVVYCPGQVQAITQITNHIQCYHGDIGHEFPVERPAFQGLDEAWLSPVPNEDIAAEKERENKIVFVKQVRNEQEECADKNSPVAVIFGVINKKEYAAQENQKTERKIERERGGEGKAFVADRHAENKQ